MIEQNFHKLENKFKESLNGNMLENAMDFMSFLKENNMTFADGAVNYQNKVMCYMHIDDSKEEPGPWTIWTEGDYSNDSTNMQLKEIAWSHINFCGSCGGDCSPGKPKNVFGKEFNNVCNAVMAFYLPNAETLECVKELLLIRKNSIDN